MRTTLTLEPDVAARLDEMREVRGESLKDLVNHALRLGLRDIETPGAASSAQRYRIMSTSLGGCRLPDLNDISEALSLAEGPGFR